MKNPKFVVFKSDVDGDYYFHLKAANGEIILNSEGYETKAGCLNGIQSVKINSRSDKNYRVKKARNGQHYFLIFAQNFLIIGQSEMYSTKQNAHKGIKAVQKVAETASIDYI